jgi:hypothetical protein
MMAGLATLDQHRTRQCFAAIGSLLVGMPMFIVLSGGQAASNKLNRVLPGNHAPDEKHDDGAYNRPDEASAFAGPVKTQGLPEEAGDKSSNDS